MKSSQPKGVKPKIWERKLRSGVNWEGTLKQKRRITKGRERSVACIVNIIAFMTKDCVTNVSTLEFCNLVVSQNVTYSHRKTWNFKSRIWGRPSGKLKIDFEVVPREYSKWKVRTSSGILKMKFQDPLWHMCGCVSMCVGILMCGRARACLCKFCNEWVFWLYVYCALTEVFLTLTEVFPCFFLSCKENGRVKLTKTGRGLHSS